MNLDVSLGSKGTTNVTFHQHYHGVYEGSLYVTSYRLPHWGVHFCLTDGSDSFDIREKEHIVAVRDILTNIINDMEAS